jgi:hypothetical protein
MIHKKDDDVLREGFRKIREPLQLNIAKAVMMKIEKTNKEEEEEKYQMVKKKKDAVS